MILHLVTESMCESKLHSRSGGWWVRSRPPGAVRTHHPPSDSLAHFTLLISRRLTLIPGRTAPYVYKELSVRPGITQTGTLVLSRYRSECPAHQAGSSLELVLVGRPTNR